MNKREIKQMLKSFIPDMIETESFMDDDKYLSVYIGSFMSLDPCGRYHHILSPNGITSRCERFWDNMDECASELNCWIESGEGDPTDIFLCKSINE